MFILVPEAKLEGNTFMGNACIVLSSADLLEAISHANAHKFTTSLLTSG